MKKESTFWIAVLTFLTGVVVGWAIFISPVSTEIETRPQVGIGGAPEIDVKQSSALEMIKNWGEMQHSTTKLLIKKYGEPDEVTPSKIVWYDNQPWKRIIVYRDAIQHNFPSPHLDFLEQTIEYSVTEDKFDELAMFNGSIIIDKTSGELLTRSDKEEANYLALNLADEIIKEKKNVEEARNFYTDQNQKLIGGEITEYTQGLLFLPGVGAPDSDMPHL